LAADERRAERDAIAPSINRPAKPPSCTPVSVPTKINERSGYTIIVNVGDQQSDFAGGYAERAYKVPDPFYFIP
jgi:hypothetical protein